MADANAIHIDTDIDIDNQKPGNMYTAVSKRNVLVREAQNPVDNPVLIEPGNKAPVACSMPSSAEPTKLAANEDGIVAFLLVMSVLNERVRIMRSNTPAGARAEISSTHRRRASVSSLSAMVKLCVREKD